MAAFFKIHNKTGTQRYTSIIAFIKNYELKIKHNETIEGVDAKIDLRNIQNLKLRTAIKSSKFYSVVKQSGQPDYMPTKQLSFLLKMDDYLYEYDKTPEELTEDDINIVFMLHF